MFIPRMHLQFYKCYSRFKINKANLSLLTIISWTRYFQVLIIKLLHVYTWLNYFTTQIICLFLNVLFSGLVLNGLTRAYFAKSIVSFLVHGCDAFEIL